MLQGDGEAVQGINGGVQAIEEGGKHDHVAGRELVPHHQPAAIAQYQGFAQVTQHALRNVVALRGAHAIEVDAIGLGCLAAQKVFLAAFGTGEFHCFDGANGSGNAAGDVLPHFVPGVEVGTGADGAAAGDPHIGRQHADSDQRHFPVLRQHDDADANQADDFRRNLLGEGVYHGRHLIRLVDAFGETRAGLAGEER